MNLKSLARIDCDLLWFDQSCPKGGACLVRVRYRLALRSFNGHGQEERREDFGHQRRYSGVNAVRKSARNLKNRVTYDDQDDDETMAKLACGGTISLPA